MAAGASTVIVTEAEAVRGAHCVIAGQLVHTRNFTLPGGHSWDGSGGGQSGAEMNQKEKKLCWLPYCHISVTCISSAYIV